MTTVLLTGGHSGLGRETSKRLAQTYGANLILTGRDRKPLEAFADTLREGFHIAVTPIEMDVASLDSIRAAFQKIEQLAEAGRIEPLSALVLNAGAQFRGPARYSPDGYELTFATNYLGHFLAIQLALPLLAPNARVALTSSGTHDPASLDGKIVGRALPPNALALAHAGKGSTPLPSYGKRYTTSKLCLVMLAYELDRRARESGSNLSSIAFDPGSIPETGLLRTMPKTLQRLGRSGFAKWLMRTAGLTSGNALFSGASLADLALGQRFSRKSAVYLQSNRLSLAEVRSSAISYDENLSRQLWNDSLELVST
jgi:NAD(P)-dependent dehydrogenase (short-subunit alcohol dehydrogenase family)